MVLRMAGKITRRQVRVAQTQHFQLMLEVNILKQCEKNALCKTTLHT